MGKIQKFFETSVLQTIHFNLHYFGLKGMRFPVLVSRNYSLTSLNGTVSLNKLKTGCIRLGYTSVGIFDRRFDRGIWQCSGEVAFEGEASFGQGSKISVGVNGRLRVGAGFRNTAKGEFVCHEEMYLSSDSLVSWDTLFMDTDTHQIDNKPTSAPVVLGDNVWVGCRCLVLKGAVVPDGSVLAAGTTVTRSLAPERALFGGLNKLLRTEIEWHV